MSPMTIPTADVEKHVAEVLAAPYPATITNDQEQAEAMAYIARGKKVLKFCESLYEPLIKQLKATIKQHQDEAKAKLAPLESRIGAVSQASIAYFTRQQDEARKKQERENAKYDRKVEKAGPDAVLPPPPVVAAPAKHLNTEAGQVQFRTVKKFRIADPALIPDEYWVLDEVKIGKAIRAGVTIPGVTPYEDKVMAAC